MPEINDFIDDLVNKHEVFADAFFIQDAAIVTENFHHSVNDV